jgi:hypothetical protein
MVNRIIRGESLKIGDIEIPVPDIISEIRNAMLSDPEDPDALSRDFLSMYLNSSPEHRTVINETLIALCGFGIRTLLEESVADEAIYPALGLEPPADKEPESDDDAD